MGVDVFTLYHCGCCVEVLDKLVFSIFMVDPELKTGIENTLAPWKC